jgi:hypothetical protein
MEPLKIQVSLDFTPYLWQIIDEFKESKRLHRQSEEVQEMASLPT